MALKKQPSTLFRKPHDKKQQVAYELELNSANKQGAWKRTQASEESVTLTYTLISPGETQAEDPAHLHHTPGAQEIIHS